MAFTVSHAVIALPFRRSRRLVFSALVVGSMAPDFEYYLRLTFTGTHVTGQRLPKGSIGEGDIKLAADGKTMDAVGTTGGFKGKSVPGIFKIQGDTLRW